MWWQKMLICWVLLIISIQQIFSAPAVNKKYIKKPQEDDNNNNIHSDDENNDKIDLTHLGTKIYGNPNKESGKRVKKWNKKERNKPEELGTYLQGDILFPLPDKRNALLRPSARWKNGIVPYKFEGKLFTKNDKAIIRSAMEEFHKYTCIKFRKIVPTDKDYLAIINTETGCWSSIGKIGNRQELNLQSPSCTSLAGTPLHELMHAIGFDHEQNREDRDKYITVITTNADKALLHNFDKPKPNTTTTYLIPYNYHSIMHYSDTAFSINGEPTMAAKAKNVVMGHRNEFMDTDIEKINTMYRCPKKKNY